ncbi:DNA adenine methylase [Pinibacter soli]|uniref:DNA adenine methylase n=1 Tax=Pinibacter soli TaxID=3044211 RepID=A0ABT6R970_9BACT|nr:DNA adenine methylase [Pinibacter soli]MDI3319113.1 DNA adenine methylase [Pinibacter soli]
MKSYNKAPLPFMGQKRNFLKDLKEVLKQYPEDATYIDLFGGSGLLAHTIKQELPKASVIYNDFDGYHERIDNIPKTNKLLADIRKIVADCPKDKLIPAETKARILKRIAKDEKAGFVDYVTLSSSLLFSANYVTSFKALSASTMYNCVRQGDYNADGYLTGVERVSASYETIYRKYKDNPNVVFVADPPYLSTETGTYKMYWKLKDYLNVLQVLEKHRYVYFTSNKSQILELCEWIQTRTMAANPFAGATVRTVNATVNYNSSYTDVMVFKSSV